MKKSLAILVAAITATASAETITGALALESTFSNRLAQTTATFTPEGGTLFTLMDAVPTTVTTVRTNDSSTVSYMSSGDVGGASNYLVPNQKVGDGSPWTMTFAYDMSGCNAYTLSNVSIDAVICNSSGGNQQDDKQRDVNFIVDIYVGATSQPGPATLTKIGTATLEWRQTGGTFSGVHTFSAALTAEAGQTLTDITQDGLYVKVTATSEGLTNVGAYYGLESVSLTGTATVPEPATATLSLFALAALAARRRRK